MSRVNFHGVIEKEELLKIVLRLWKQEMKAQRGNLNRIEWGSEIWTSLEFKRLKIGWVVNDLDFEWDMKSGSPTTFNLNKWMP